MFSCTTNATHCDAALLANISAVAEKYSEYETTRVGLESAYNTMWVLICSTLVFFMQSGFAMLEAGQVRRKNVANILFKNVFDPVLTAFLWWALGYGLAFGSNPNSTTGNGFLGNGDFFLLTSGSPMRDYPTWVFQWAFSAAAATIVSGAIAERCQLFSYFVYSAFLCGLVYPIVVHWVWSGEGWLSAFAPNAARLNHGLLDFAGSGVVHMVGGFAALAGAYVCQPRLGWAENQAAIAEATTREERRKLEREFAPHDRTMMTLGTLVLWFGWFGFNCGSTLGLSGGLGAVAGKVGVNTVLGAAGGGISTLVLSFALDPDHRLLLDPVMNGILGGLVSITAGCSIIEPYAAVVTGLIAGLVYCGSSRLVSKLGIDDVLDASPVHGFCGYWGIVSVGFFATKSNLIRAFSVAPEHLDDMAGVFYGGNGKQLGTQLLGGLVILLWSFLWSFIVFFLLRVAGILRVSPWSEVYGLDASEHGASAFSKSFQWVSHSIAPVALKSANKQPLKPSEPVPVNEPVSDQQ